MDRQELARDLAMMLLELSAWEEGKGRLMRRCAWKGYDFDCLNDLAEEGFITDSRRGKLVGVTEAGSRHAEELYKKYGIQLDPIPSPQRFFRLHLRFDFEELACMRTLLVPEHTSFEDFHTMIQACLNWMNYHLYDFQLEHDGARYRISWPGYDTGGEEIEDTWLDSAKAYLDDFFPTVREALYSYDYGDGWEIVVQLLNPHEKLERDKPLCWEGSGDAPPEDVGGEGGFARFLEAIEDEGDPEHEHLAAWGEGQGFERFSQRRANRRLERWQDWARIEEDDAMAAYTHPAEAIPGGRMATESASE